MNRISVSPRTIWTFEGKDYKNPTACRDAIDTKLYDLIRKDSKVEGMYAGDLCKMFEALLNNRAAAIAILSAEIEGE